MPQWRVSSCKLLSEICKRQTSFWEFWPLMYLLSVQHYSCMFYFCHNFISSKSLWYPDMLFENFPSFISFVNTKELIKKLLISQLYLTRWNITMKSVKLLSVKDGFSKNMFDTIPIKAEAESQPFVIQFFLSK